MVITLTRYSRTRAARYGYDEALILDTDGYVSEGAGENIFIVRKGNLITTDLSTCLEGITRDTVISLAKELGISIIEKRINGMKFTAQKKHFSQERPPKLLL